jgi:hypothetical protein
MDDEIFENVSNEFGIEHFRRVDLGWFMAVSPVEDFDKAEREVADSYGG